MVAITVTPAVAVALALVAALELVAAAFIVALTVAALALEALAARTTVLACFLRGSRAIGGGGRNGWRRCIATVLAEILVPTAAAVLLALVALAGFAGGRRRTVVVGGVMALTMALGARPALFRTATGPPDFHQFRLGRRGFGAGSGFAGRSGLCRCLGRRFDGLIRHSLNGFCFCLGRRSFVGNRGFRRSLNGLKRSLNGRRRRFAD